MSTVRTLEFSWSYKRAKFRKFIFHFGGTESVGLGRKYLYSSPSPLRAWVALAGQLWKHLIEVWSEEVAKMAIADTFSEISPTTFSVVRKYDLNGGNEEEQDFLCQTTDTKLAFSFHSHVGINQWNHLNGTPSKIQTPEFPEAIFAPSGLRGGEADLMGEGSLIP